MSNRGPATSTPALDPGNNLGGVEYLDTGIPGEASSVKCENRRDSVHLHRRHQPSVMRGLAVHLKLGYQTFPGRVNGRRIR